MQRSAGIVLIIGSLMFLIGVLTPVMLNVFGNIGNPELQLEYLEKDPTGWDVSNAVNGAGSLVAAIGLGLFARQVQSVSNNKNVRMTGYIGAAMAILGALCWVIISYYRIVLSPEEITNDVGIPNGLYTAYYILTLIALLISGFVLLRSGYPKWLGWLVLVLAGLMLVAYLALGGLPPGVYYPILLVMGITLVVIKTPQLSNETGEIKGAVSESATVG